MSETAIRALEQKLMEQYRDLLAKSKREKKRATKKTIKNEYIQLPEKPKWTLKQERGNISTNILIAQVRWLFHCELCNVDHNRKKE